MVSVNDLIIDRIGRNEISHMSVSMNLTLFFGVLLNPTYGLIISIIIGVIKEISDGFEEDNHFSFKDILYNTIGNVLGLVTLYLI